jgi:hypothetical protein
MQIVSKNKNNKGVVMAWKRTQLTTIQAVNSALVDF